MAEFEEIKTFIRTNHNIIVVDITKNLSVDTYDYYCNLAIKNPQKVYISKRSIKNNKLFNILASITTDELNKPKYLLLKNDNYHIAHKFSKAYISKFVSGSDKDIYECGVCYDHTLLVSICPNCTFIICNSCVESLWKSNNLKCPQCREDSDVYSNPEATESKMIWESKHKLNTDH